MRPPPLYRVWIPFAEPVTDTEGVAFHLPRLAEALAAALGRDGQGARRLRLTGFRVDGRATMIEAGLSAPAAGATHLVRLLREKGLERLDLGFGLDALMLSAEKAETIEAREAELDASPAQPSPDAIATLIDRLAAKLGEGQVRRPQMPGELDSRAQRGLDAGRPRPQLAARAGRATPAPDPSVRATRTGDDPRRAAGRRPRPLRLAARVEARGQGRGPRAAERGVVADAVE